MLLQENAFENVVWKMAAILSRPQCVKTYNDLAGKEHYEIRYWSVFSLFRSRTERAMIDNTHVLCLETTDIR